MHGPTRFIAHRLASMGLIVIALLLVACESGVQVTQIDAPGVIRIKTNPDVQVIDANWSADSKSLVIASWEGGSGDGLRGAVYLTDFLGGQILQLSGSAKLFNLQNPTFSPDGQRISFFAEPGAQILVLNKQTHEIKPVTEANYAAWSPTWDRIALWNAKECEPELSRSTSICILDRKTGIYTPIYSTTQEFAFGGMEWSRDGSRLATSFQEVHPNSNAPRHKQINLFDIRSGQRQPITSGSSDASDPSWSPDNQAIAYVQSGSKPGQDRIMVIRADGSCPIQIISDQGSINALSWSPNGKHLLFVDYYRPYLIDLDNTSIQQTLEGLNCDKPN